MLVGFVLDPTPVIGLPGTTCTNHSPSPVVIVPGNFGSRLEATWVALPGCAAQSDWAPLWFSNAILNENKCWATHMSLLFDPTTNTSRYQPGMNVRVPGFGSWLGVEALDISSQEQIQATGKDRTSR